MDEKITDLENRITELERKLKDQASLIDTFSGNIVFKKEVQFMARVRNRAGTIVTSINNI